jgi:hypothetical protein
MALYQLVETRLRELGLSKEGFTEKLGIKHPAKAQNLFRKLQADDMRNMPHMRRSFATVLRVPQGAVDEAILASRDLRFERQDAAWRAEFRPHAVLTTAHNIPQPIFATAMTGADKKLSTVLPEAMAAIQWPKWVLERLPIGLPGFGKVTGFVINYTPDHAVRFDLEGNPVKTLDKAYWRGRVYMQGECPTFFV